MAIGLGHDTKGKFIIHKVGILPTTEVADLLSYVKSSGQADIYANYKSKSLKNRSSAFDNGSAFLSFFITDFSLLFSFSKDDCRDNASLVLFFW